MTGEKPLNIYARFFRARRFAPAPNELQLLRRASLAYPELQFDDLTGEILAQVNQEHGTDFATALFYDRLRRSEKHGPFIAAVDAIEPNLEQLPQLPGKLLIAPAAFYRQVPELGGDGRLIADIGAGFGLETRVLPLLSTGSVRANAAIIRQALAQEADGSVILASLSKGGADLRVALETDPSLCRKIRVWIQIGGLVRGSPLINALLNGCWWQQLLLYAYLVSIRASWQLLPELKSGPSTLLGRPPGPFPGVQIINVIGCPLTYQMIGNRQIRYQYLSALGPNDGSTLLAEAILEPGLIYPLWGADHYFRVPQTSRLLYQLFLYLSQSGQFEPIAKENKLLVG
jgi:hypothetical protein